MIYYNRIEVKKHKVLNKYPDAKIIGVGSNNLVTGIWFKLPNKNIRTFIKLMEL